MDIRALEPFPSPGLLIFLHPFSEKRDCSQVYDQCCRLKIARVPGYKDALKLLEQRESPILLDIGCCCALSQSFPV